MADAELPQQQTEKAREFAKESADGFLMQQIQAVHLCMEFQKAVARVEFLRSHCIGAKSMKDRRVSTEQIDALNQLRSFHQALAHFSDERGYLFQQTDVRGQLVHHGALDNILDFLALSASAVERTHDLEARFKASWEGDLQMLQAGVTSLIPRWTESDKESLLANRERVSKFLALEESTLHKISALVTELRAQLRMMKGLKGSPLLTQVKLDGTSAFITHAVATVVYHSVIEATEKTFVHIESPVECKQAVDELRKRLSPRGIPFTSAMETCLSEWSTGAKLGAAPAPGLAAGPAAPAAPAAPDAGASSTPTKIAPAEPAAGPTAPAEPAAAPAEMEVDAAQPEAGDVKRKLSLSDRLKLAAEKRRRSE